MSRKALSDASIFVSTFETLRDGVSILDLEFNVLKVNAIIQQWYAGTQLVGKKCYEAYHRRTTPCEVCPSRETMDTGEIAHKLQHKRLDDTSCWLDIYTFPLLDPATKEMMGVVEYVRDVTEQRETEAAFFKEQEKYRTLAESAPLGISIIGEDGQYKYLNPRFVEMFGYSLEDIPTGRKWFTQAYPDPAQRLRAFSDWKIYLQESQLGETEPRVFTVTCKDGSTRVINFRAVPLEGGDQFLLYEDITERLKAVVTLRDSEEKYRLLVQQIPALVFKGYEDWSVDCFDNKIEELTGYCAEDFNSRRLKWCDLIPDEDLPELKRIFQEALKGDRGYLREHRIKKKNGEYAWVQCRGQICCAESGEVKHINGVTFDITSRKQAEKALQESEERYRVMAEHVSDVIWTSTLDLRLTYVSPSVQQMLGFTPEEIVGKPLGETLTPVSLGRALEVLNQEMAKEKKGLADPNRSRVLELEEVHKNGDIIRTEVKASFIRDSAHQPQGILGVTRDITRRKRAEEALRRREAVLEAVSFAAEKFLRDPDWEGHIQEILGRLGKAIEACRVNIFENRQAAHGTLLTGRYEWVAEGVKTRMPAPHLQGISYRDAGFGHWEDKLSQGQVIFGDVEDFLPAEQKLLAPHKIKSILVLPIFVGQEWWGFIGFDACRRKRSWPSLVVDALLTAASTLGAAILHNQSEKALRESEEKLRALSNQLLHAQEGERKRLATELHNVLGHDLLLLKLKLESLQEELGPEQSTQEKEVQKIVRALQDSLGNVRRLYQDLTPGDLEDLGLTTALRVLVENFAGAQKLKWQTDLDDLDDVFAMPVQTAIYRMVQEALTNVGKHAQAKKLSLRARRAGTEVSFSIEDDGQGFNVAKALAAKNTLGLLAMEERVKSLGGACEIISRKKEGTKISFTIPLS